MRKRDKGTISSKRKLQLLGKRRSRLLSIISQDKRAAKLQLAAGISVRKYSCFFVHQSFKNVISHCLKGIQSSSFSVHPFLFVLRLPIVPPNPLRAYILCTHRILSFSSVGERQFELEADNRTSCEAWMEALANR